MKHLNKILLLAVAILLIAVASEQVSANAYTGYNTIGSYYQYQYGYSYGGNYNSYRAPGGTINLGNPYYAYPTVPRAGGWFGGGTGWLTGLRQPYYAGVAPTHYSYFYRPQVPSGGWFGSGDGYPRMPGTYRVRYGGGFRY